MTHEELLAEIDFLPLDGLHKWFQPALRAVAELHKPYEWSDDNKTIYESCNYCSVISSAIDIPYPCPTIQAIEKELNG